MDKRTKELQELRGKDFDQFKEEVKKDHNYITPEVKEILDILETFIREFRVSKLKIDIFGPTKAGVFQTMIKGKLLNDEDIHLSCQEEIDDCVNKIIAILKTIDTIGAKIRYSCTGRRHTDLKDAIPTEDCHIYAYVLYVDGEGQIAFQSKWPKHRFFEIDI